MTRIDNKVKPKAAKMLLIGEGKCSTMREVYALPLAQDGDAPVLLQLTAAPSRSRVTLLEKRSPAPRRSGEMADAGDLKSSVPKGASRFDPGLRHDCFLFGDSRPG